MKTTQQLGQLNWELDQFNGIRFEKHVFMKIDVSPILIKMGKFPCVWREAQWGQQEHGIKVQGQLCG